MATDHPFHQLFESLDGRIQAHSPEVNHRAFTELLDALDAPAGHDGRCILLKAPRAGHGKTHLLAQARHALSATHEFIALRPASGATITAESAIDDTLGRLCRPLPAAGGLTVLDLATRRLLAKALEPLVISGEVPCQDRDGALAALRARPIETFDFHHPNAVTAQWARENFEVLGQRLAVEMAQRLQLPFRDVAYWVDLLFQYASATPDNPQRARNLAAATSGRHDIQSLLATMLGLLGSVTRVVIVADELEGFSADESAALRLAAMLAALRQAVNSLDVVISINQDVWENAFLPRLSGGLADRLSEVRIDLSPLSKEEMAALIESRAPGLGSQVLEHLEQDAQPTHARGLLQSAARAWIAASRAATAPPPAAPPITEEPTPEPSPPEAPAADEPIPEAPTQPEPVAPQPHPADSPHEDADAKLPADPPQCSLVPEPHDEVVRLVPENQDSPPRPAVPPQSPQAGNLPEPESESAAQDRVEDLLRQFRERYGKSGGL